MNVIHVWAFAFTGCAFVMGTAMLLQYTILVCGEFDLTYLTELWVVNCTRSTRIRCTVLFLLEEPILSSRLMYSDVLTATVNPT